MNKLDDSINPSNYLHNYFNLSLFTHFSISTAKKIIEDNAIVIARSVNDNGVVLKIGLK